MIPFPFNTKPSSVFERYKGYMQVYNDSYSVSIMDKNYEITLVRGLIMYFLSREKERGFEYRMSSKEIAMIFGLKSDSAVRHSNKRIKEYIENPISIGRKERKLRFFYLFYRFNQIFTTKTKKKKILQ